MVGWHKDGRPLDDEALADLLDHDGKARVEYGGAVFRFRAETVAARRPARTGETVVLSLHQLGGGDPRRAVYLVDFAESRLDAEGCGLSQAVLDRATQTTMRTTRRRVGGQLFRQAQELIAAEGAA